MPNDYAAVRTARKGPQIKMGQGMQRVQPVEPGDPGTGKYNDRIKIQPKIQIKETPKLSDTEIQKHISTAETKI